MSNVLSGAIRHGLMANNKLRSKCGLIPLEMVQSYKQEINDSKKRIKSDIASGIQRTKMNEQFDKEFGEYNTKIKTNKTNETDKTNKTDKSTKKTKKPNFAS